MRISRCVQESESLSRTETLTDCVLVPKPPAVLVPKPPNPEVGAAAELPNSPPLCVVVVVAPNNPPDGCKEKHGQVIRGESSYFRQARNTLLETFPGQR